MDEDIGKEARENAGRALAEDVGDGDLTAALVPGDARAEAAVVARESAIVCGRPWFDAVFEALGGEVAIDWRIAEGRRAESGAKLCLLNGPARAILTGERTALNFLQLLSATATTAACYAAVVEGTGCRILDTRKTIPGLRRAQKYAVRIGGATNHRAGLYDAILIKDNHIRAAGGIAAAVHAARRASPEIPVEVEVESLEELRAALAAGAARLLLDNFDLATLGEAVAINRAEGDPPASLEASGGLMLDEVRAVAETGVDFISVGALTKNVRAIDLSMEFRR